MPGAPRQGNASKVGTSSVGPGLGGLGRLLFALAVCLVVAFPYFEQVRNANELPRLMQGIALAEDGELAIDGPANQVLRLDWGPDVAKSPTNDRVYPNKPPGSAPFAAAAWLTARIGSQPPTLREYTWWARLFGGLLPTLVLCGFAFWRHARREGEGVATVGVLLYALATPAASYAHLFYGHQLAACLLYVGVSTLLDGRRSASPRRAALGGALAGGAVAVEYGAAFCGLPIAALLLWDLRDPARRGTVAAALGGALVPVLVLAGYHDAAYGSPWSTGYHHAMDAGFAAKHGVGLLGLGVPTWQAFSTHMLALDTGLLWWAPLMMPALYVMVAGMRRGDAAATEHGLWLGIFGVMVVVGSGLSFEGGWRVGPRYLVVALPALVPGFVALYEQARTSGTWMSVLGVLGTWSAAVGGLAANFWPHVDPTNVHSPVSELLVPLLREGYHPYGPLAGLGGPGGWVLFALPIVVLSAGLLRYAEPSFSGLVGYGLGVVTALTLVFGVSAFAFPEHPRGKANLRYVQRVYEPPPTGAAPDSRALDLPRR